MRKITLLFAALGCIMMAQAVNYGVRFGNLEVTSKNKNDIFGDGKAAYNPGTNTLVLQDGFSYSLGKGLVTIDTKQETFVIELKGDAVIKAAVRCSKPVRITADKPCTLSITSNISGSALQCAGLSIAAPLTLKLLSRNSQRDMYALDCNGKIEVAAATLFAEVTTADMAIKANELLLEKSLIEKPKGGGLNADQGGLCFGDGTPAKIVRIVPKKEEDNK